MARKSQPPSFEQTLDTLRAHSFTVKPFPGVPDGMMVSTHAAANLTGAIIDLERTGRLDATVRRTLRRVEKQLRKIGKILEV